MEAGLTRNDMLRELIRSPHGKLEEFTPAGKLAAVQDPQFFAHLIAWNEIKGSIRDSKVALPIIGLASSPEPIVTENNLAHLALLSPRELCRAVRFAKQVRPLPGAGGRLRGLVERYVRAREHNVRWFDRTAIQHRTALKELYALNHIAPSTYADDVLFKGKKFGVYAEIANLRNAPPTQAAASILRHRIPFLVAVSAMGPNASTDFVLALIESMSTTEVVTNTKLLQTLGMNNVPALRAAYDAKLKAVAESKQATFKSGIAAAASGNAKLANAAEKQLNTLGIDGNWLVLGDKSASMDKAIEVAKEVAATLARLVTGNVHLVFFDAAPTVFDVKGKTLEEIKAMTHLIRANGPTSIGTGLRWAQERALDIDGIAIVTDGGENNQPWFRDVYPKYCTLLGKDLPVYVYKLQGDSDTFTMRAGTDCQVFDLRMGFDYHSLPNLVQTMRPNRYGLTDEILATPLRTVDEVFSTKQKEAA